MKKGEWRIENGKQRMENEEKRLEYGEWENTKGNLKWDMYNGQQRVENGEWRADFHQCCDFSSETRGFLDGEGCVRVIDLERFSCQASHTAYCTITLFPCSGAQPLVLTTQLVSGWSLRDQIILKRLVRRLVDQPLY